MRYSPRCIVTLTNAVSTNQGAYYFDFARLARGVTNLPLMLTGGFKRRDQAVEAVDSGIVDMVCLGRAMALNPRLADAWLSEESGDPIFPKFDSVVPGGITAWYTMRLTALGEDRECVFDLDLSSAIQEYEERDAHRCNIWQKKFPLLEN